MHVAPRVADFLLYVFGCGLLMLAGVGILRLLRVPIDRASSMLFGPAVAQAAWAVFLGAGVTLRQPVRLLAGPLWLFTLVCAALGWYNLHRGDASGSNADSQRSDRVWPLVAFCAVLPILVLLPYFAFGITEYAGSRHPDAWSYAALGQSVWTMPLGHADGSSPLYQYASNLIFGRTVGSSELGLVSVLINPGDTQAASGLFLALAFFTFATACATFARTMRMRPEQTIVFLLLAVASGWSLNALLISNFDNILALFFFPALAVVGSSRRPAGQSWWILGAVFLAALLYTYPEMGVLVCAPAAVIFAERLYRISGPRERWQALLGIAIVLCLMFPFAEHLVAYFRMQVAIGLQPEGMRPGGRSFETLSDPKLVSSAFWALGAELRHLEVDFTRFVAARSVVGMVLFGIFCLGLVRLVRARELGLAAALSLPILGGSAFIIWKAYGYGAYKPIFMGWWIIAFVTVTGTSAGWSPRRRWLSLPGLIVCLCVPAVAVARNVRYVKDSPAFGMSRFRAVEQVGILAGNEPVGVFVENGEASMWAVYYLRASKLWVGDFEGLLGLPFIRPLLNRSSPAAPTGLRYLLTTAVDPGPVTEDEGWALVWQSGAYRLWDASDTSWAIVTEASTPNGFEQVKGAPFFWMGGGPTRFHLIAAEPGCLRLSANVTPGPSVQSQSGRTVSIESPAAPPSRRVVLGAGYNEFGIPIGQGVNDVALIPEDAVDAPADSRPLILGLSDIRSRFEPTRASIVRVENRNGLERVNGQPFVWLGDGSTVVTLMSNRAGEIGLAADVLMGPSVAPSVTTRQLRVRIEALGFDKHVEVAGGSRSLPVPVAQGETVITVDPLDVPTIPIQPNGDHRPLVVGLSGLHLDTRNLLASCQ